MREIDRTGIFKVRPLAWKVKTFEGKTSVAVSIDFVVVAELHDDEWFDWSNFEEHHVAGDYWVVKKDGTPNVETIQQLANALGWNGSLADVVSKDPPKHVVVQVTIKDEVYNGKTYFKAGWMNPGDYVPTRGGGASTEQVQALEARFGSLLRAAASTKAHPAAKATAPKPAPAPAAAKPNYDDIPF